jgi:hypothetical protein
MTEDIKKVADMLSAPMEEVIAALGTGIARAQRELDRYAITAQQEIDQDPLLSEAGLQATFYQIPRAELELNIAIALEENTKPVTSGNTLTAISATALKASSIRQIHLQPVNASYANQFNFNTQASSKVKLTIVPVPPPGADGIVSPRMKQDEVLKIAQDKFVSAQNARVSFNFNGRSRVWVVLQYALEGDTTRRLALIVIDDDTGAIIKSE